jgi:hypothetical protein
MSVPKEMDATQLDLISYKVDRRVTLLNHVVILGITS